jgi:chaperonin GroES
MNIKPLGNRAVIKLSKTKTTKSGLIIALEEKTEQALGEVIAIGQGFDSPEGNISTLNLNIGDNVLLTKYGGETIKDENDETIEYKIVSIKDIVAVIEK